MKRTHPVSLASVLDTIVESSHMRVRMAERKAVALWPGVVGTAMAARATAIEAERGSLKLRCDSPILRQEIMMGREALIRNLNSMAGREVIKDIVFI